MNWIDLLLAVLIVSMVAAGVRKGISHSGFGLLAVVVAFLTAAWLFPAGQLWFLVTFAGMICAAGAGAFFLGRWFQKTDQKWLDGLLGGAFGLVNAVLLVVCAAVALMAFAPKFPREQVAGSNLAPYVLEAAWTVAGIVPDEMKDRVEQSYVELEQVLPQRFRKAIPPLPRNEI
jgi:uncharacterized membrane protein required for colicin V production